MTDTNTLINWPARLKIGARSKKGITTFLFQVKVSKNFRKTERIFFKFKVKRNTPVPFLVILAGWRQID